MALFKILRGGAETLKKQPLHDGWAYFTPENGQLHIDVVGEVGGKDYGEGERILVAGRGSAIILDRTLYANSWDENTQTIYYEDLNGNYEAIVKLNDSNGLDFSVVAAAAKADIKVSISGTTVTFTANGNVPTVDIPLIIYIWEKE